MIPKFIGTYRLLGISSSYSQSQIEQKRSMLYTSWPDTDEYKALTFVASTLARALKPQMDGSDQDAYLKAMARKGIVRAYHTWNGPPVTDALGLPDENGAVSSYIVLKPEDGRSPGTWYVIHFDGTKLPDYICHITKVVKLPFSLVTDMIRTLPFDPHNYEVLSDAPDHFDELFQLSSDDYSWTSYDELAKLMSAEKMS